MALAGTMETSQADPGLLRALGPGTALAVVVGNVIGSGIFAKPGTIAEHAGDFRLILLAWVAGGILCLAGALCFAELASMMPQAGGLYVFLREAYGRPTAFLYGWNEVLFQRPASIGALSVIFVGSIMEATGWHANGTVRLALSIALITAVAWTNVLGVLWGGRIQNLTTLVKAGGVLLITLLPLASLAIWGSGLDLAHYSTRTSPPAGMGLAGRFGVVLLAVMWAYNGWHGVTPVCEEIREPQRTIPRALLLGVGVLTGLYVGANLAYHGVLSMQEVRDAGEHTAEHMVRRLLGPAGGAAMSLLVMCSTFGAINANLLITPRVAFAMGRDGLLDRRLGCVHHRYRTPAIAILSMAFMAIFLVVVSAVLVERVASLGGRSIFDLLTDTVIFAGSIFALLGVSAVIVLRWTRPDWERPYRAWGYPFVPLLFILAYLWFLQQVYWEKPFESRVGLVLIALGLPVHFGILAWQRRTGGTGEGTA